MAADYTYILPIGCLISMQLERYNVDFKLKISLLLLASRYQ